jgi:hypothetical protein
MTPNRTLSRAWGLSEKEAELERNVESARKAGAGQGAISPMRLRGTRESQWMSLTSAEEAYLTQNDLNWAKVNQRNKELNEAADFEAFKEQKARAEAEAKSGGQPKFNPYARRKVKPKMLWEVGQKDEKKDDDPKEKGPEIQIEKAVDETNGHHDELLIKAARTVERAEGLLRATNSTSMKMRTLNRDG